MCWSEQIHYNDCNHYIRTTYGCPCQKKIHRIDLDCMWLSECNMQDIQPAKEEQGSCGRCGVQPLVLAQDDQIYELDGHTSFLDSSLAGRGLDTPEYPHGCDTTSVLSTDDQGLDPAADD
jgi:hypothetical protein